MRSAEFEEIDVVATEFLGVRGHERPVGVADEVLENIGQGSLDLIDLRQVHAGDLEHRRAVARRKFLVGFDQESLAHSVDASGAGGVRITDRERPHAVAVIGDLVEQQIGQVLVVNIAGVLAPVGAVRNELQFVLACEYRLRRILRREVEAQRRKLADAQAAVAAHAHVDRHRHAAHGDRKRQLGALVRAVEQRRQGARELGFDQFR